MNWGNLCFLSGYSSKIYDDAWWGIQFIKLGQGNLTTTLLERTSGEMLALITTTQ
jgi:hypothetical protein